MAFTLYQLRNTKWIRCNHYNFLTNFISWNIVSTPISYQSSSTGYFPVRQAVQWPFFSKHSRPFPFSWIIISCFPTFCFLNVIPSCTDETSPSTDRYTTLFAPIGGKREKGKGMRLLLESKNWPWLGMSSG